jgi:hypothetical protein
MNDASRLRARLCCIWYALLSDDSFIPVSFLLLPMYKSDCSSSVQHNRIELIDPDGPRPLSQSVVGRLPKFQFDIDSECVDYPIRSLVDNPSCSICISDYIRGETLRKLPYCQHVFHQTCVDEWLAINGTCPVCRLRCHGFGAGASQET